MIVPRYDPGAETALTHLSDTEACFVLAVNVALYDEVGQLMILLNTSAAAVWELCDGTRTLDEIGRALAEAHGADRADAAVIDDDVRLTVRKLADLGLVVDAGT